MALKATIFKAELQVSDLDRHRYGTYSLTLARHPSETDERMMVRLVAFALNADERLEFGRGLSAEDEADLVKTDLTGTIELWIDVGLPDERDIRKAAGRARSVAVYLYGGRGAAMWWKQNEAAMAKIGNVAVYEIPEDVGSQLAALAQRTMRVECTIQEGQVYLHSGDAAVHFEPITLKRGEP